MEWPGTTHKVPLTDLKEAISPAMQQLPIDRHLLRVTLKSNFTFKSSQTGFSATPDPHNVPTLSRVTQPPEGENRPSVTGQRRGSQGLTVTM